MPNALVHGTCFVLLQFLHLIVITVALGLARAAEMTIPGTRNKWFTSVACTRQRSLTATKQRRRQRGGTLPCALTPQKHGRRTVISRMGMGRCSDLNVTWKLGTKSAVSPTIATSVSLTASSNCRHHNRSRDDVFFPFGDSFFFHVCATTYAPRVCTRWAAS